MVEDEIGTGWVMGDTFTMADCAAMPALFYADRVAPLANDFPKTAHYLERLEKRPSVTRVLTEAQPYFAMFPKE
jgi:glutathione S-transferase